MVKLAQLINPDFQQALGLLAQKEIPLRTSFKLKGVIKRLGDEVKTYNEVRTDLLNKFGEKEEDGTTLKVNKETNNVEFTGDNLKLFGSAMNELLQMEVDIGSVKLEELGDKMSLSTNHASLLDGVLVE